MTKDDNKVVLYDSTDPAATPAVFDAEPFHRFVASYPAADQQRAVLELVAGNKTLDDLGPLRGGSVTLPMPQRTVDAHEFAGAVRRYPQEWAENVAKKIIRGEMDAGGTFCV